MRAEFQHDGTCTVYTDDERVFSQFSTVYEPAFNDQYSHPLSDDGSKLLIGTWYHGLYCYDTASGRILWRDGPGKVRELIVFGDSVVVEMAGRGVWQRNLATGKITAQAPMSGIEAFFQVSTDLLFAGPKRNMYFILNLADLSERSRIPAAVLNTDSCLSFIILQAFLDGPDLVITGWDEYPNRDYRISGSRKFRRVVRNAIRGGM